MTDMKDVAELPVHAYVVLGMVALGAESGYEIKQAVDSSIRFFWTISQAQIYPSLDSLERSGLVVGRSQPSGRRPRRTYKLTPAGRVALRAWIANDDELLFELRDVGLLKLFFADASPPADGAALRESVRWRSLQRVETLKEIEPAARQVSEEGNSFPLLTLELGIAFHQAMADVCERFADRDTPEDG
jgi:PadR family transcriptional regulator AphA